jgi:hypothetical protein
MAGLVPATHAVRRPLAAPGKRCAIMHQPVTQARVDTRVKPAHDDLCL